MNTPERLIKALEQLEHQKSRMKHLSGQKDPEGIYSEKSIKEAQRELDEKRRKYLDG